MGRVIRSYISFGFAVMKIPRPGVARQVQILIADTIGRLTRRA
jgi:hypothetical protein